MILYVLMAPLILISGQTLASKDDPSTLDIAYTFEPYGLYFNPNVSSAISHVFVLQTIFEPIGVLKDGQLEYRAATLAEYREGGTKIHVTLREDLLWSNGEKTTAHDYVRGIKRALRPDSENLYDLENVVGVQPDGSHDLDSIGITVLDDFNFEIALKTPYALALESLFSLEFLPIAASDDIDGPWVDTNRPLSNGPYMIDLIANERISVVPNPYWRQPDKVFFDRINFIYTGSQANALEGFVAGKLDAVANVPAGQVEWAGESQLGASATQWGWGEGSLQRLIIHPESMLRDPEIYKAATMAIDRYTMRDSRVSDDSTLQVELALPSSVSGRGVYTAPPELEYDTENYFERLGEARAIMEAKGYSAENPLKIGILRSETSIFIRKRLLSILESNWRHIHIELVHLERGASWSDSFEIFEAGGADLFVTGFIIDMGDFITYAQHPLELRGIEEPDPIVAEKILAARSAQNSEEKQGILAELDQAVYNSAKTIALDHTMSHVIITDHLTLVHDDATLGLATSIRPVEAREK